MLLVAFKCYLADEFASFRVILLQDKVWERSGREAGSRSYFGEEVGQVWHLVPARNSKLVLERDDSGVQ
jgi:hypothetical protein